MITGKEQLYRYGSVLTAYIPVRTVRLSRCVAEDISGCDFVKWGKTSVPSEWKLMSTAEYTIGCNQKIDTETHQGIQKGAVLDFGDNVDTFR